jgi:hypothetical protein
MMPSVYDNIIAAILARLALITQANGYRTDAGLNLFHQLEYTTLPPVLPCLILQAGDVTDTLDGNVPPSQGEENHLLPLDIEGYITDAESGANGQLLRQDILQALKVDRFFGGLTEGWSGSVESSASVFDAGDDGFRSHVQVRVTIFYVTAYGEQ